ncbi:MAG: hypothetical protein M1827_003018 [Pycnora praestabilis]|nr:MAG: hypothetical protein M1827_003018 [Pycnora praestabilis]
MCLVNVKPRPSSPEIAIPARRVALPPARRSSPSPPRIITSSAPASVRRQSYIIEAAPRQPPLQLEQYGPRSPRGSAPNVIEVRRSRSRDREYVVQRSPSPAVSMRRRLEYLEGGGAGAQGPMRASRERYLIGEDVKRRSGGSITYGSAGPRRSAGSITYGGAMAEPRRSGGSLVYAASPRTSWRSTRDRVVDVDELGRRRESYR